MKKVYLLLLMLCMFVSGYGQSKDTLDGFFGCKFGSSRQVVKAIMLSKAGSKVYSEDVNSIIFTGVKFAGHKVNVIIFQFVNNKFHTAKVLLSSPYESGVIDLYNDIKSGINERYYVTDGDYERYDEPYYKDDGYTISAIKLGKANFSAYWEFSNSRSDKEDDSNTISVEISQSLSVIISYQDGVLINEVIKKNNKDY